MSSNVFRLLFIFVTSLILWYRLIQTHQHWDSILCCCGCIKYVHCPWFERFECLYFVYCAWAGFGHGKAREEKLRTCYCSCAIQHITWYVHTSFMCYTQVFWKISRVTRMRVSNLNWAVVYMFCSNHPAILCIITMAILLYEGSTF